MTTLSTGRLARRAMTALVLALAVLAAAPAFAAASQLTGHVTTQSGGSLGLEGTTVHVARASTAHRSPTEQLVLTAATRSRCLTARTT